LGISSEGRETSASVAHTVFGCSWWRCSSSFREKGYVGISICVTCEFGLLRLKILFLASRDYNKYYMYVICAVPKQVLLCDFVVGYLACLW
jgi:hypothetical protein